MFWTFTFKTIHTHESGARKWNNLARAIKREWPEARLVRVFEMHPGGHGMHIHAATPQWMSVCRMLTLTKRLGFGRVHVCLWDSKKGMAAGEYLAKYLTKRRPEYLKHKRLYGFVGIPAEDATLQRDISFRSPMVTIWNILRNHPEWGGMKFGQRTFMANRVHRAFIEFQPTEHQALALSTAEGGGEREALYLVIHGTIQQGPDTVNAAKGGTPIFSAQLRKKIDGGEFLLQNLPRLGQFRPGNYEPSIQDEIENYHEHEINPTRIADARAAGIACPF